jgi:hypothetical protein
MFVCHVRTVPVWFSRFSCFNSVCLSGSSRTGHNLVRLTHILVMYRFNFHFNHLLYFFFNYRFRNGEHLLRLARLTTPVRAELTLYERLE